MPWQICVLYGQHYATPTVVTPMATGQALFAGLLQAIPIFFCAFSVSFQVSATLWIDGGMPTDPSARRATHGLPCVCVWVCGWVRCAPAEQVMPVQNSLKERRARTTNLAVFTAMGFAAVCYVVAGACLQPHSLYLCASRMGGLPAHLLCRCCHVCVGTCVVQASPRTSASARPSSPASSGATATCSRWTSLASAWRVAWWCSSLY
jgi:hypothetical protein